MMRTVQPPAIMGRVLIKFLFGLFGIFITIIIGIAVTTVTFMETTVIEDATLKAGQQADEVCFTVLNNHTFFDITPAAEHASCAPATSPPTSSPTATTLSWTQWFFEMVQHNTIFLLANFKEFWMQSTNNTCHPFLHIRDNGNNCISEQVCGKPKISYFDIHGKRQSEFSFVTTAKSQLQATCSVTKNPPSAGALMVFYGFSCEAYTAQQSCEKQSIVHTEHRLNYFTPTR